MARLRAKKHSPARWDVVHADVMDGLAAMADGTVQCCVTSPPYWMLRDYGYDGQIGLEPTLQEYIDRIVAVFREVRRVLADDGTLWLNLGDTYLGGRNGGAGANGITSDRNHRAARAAWEKTGGRTHKTVPGLKPKDMVGVPWRVALALQADGWWLRSDIIWSKANPMPEAVTDRPTKSHEYVFLLSKSRRYFYDAEAIKEPATGTKTRRARGTVVRKDRARDEQGLKASAAFGRGPGWRVKANDSFADATNELVDTRNKRSVWTTVTEPYAEAHFATMPEALVEPCVLAGARPDSLVLDPFAGSGTVGAVAVRLGRRFHGIDGCVDYCDLARKRISRAMEKAGLAGPRESAATAGRPMQFGLWRS